MLTNRQVRKKELVLKIQIRPFWIVFGVDQFFSGDSENLITLPFCVSLPLFFPLFNHVSPSQLEALLLLREN